MATRLPPKLPLLQDFIPKCSAFSVVIAGPVSLDPEYPALGANPTDL